MNEKTEHVDLLGQEIKVGDYIGYAAIDGQSAIMRIGQVIELKSVKDRRGDVTNKVFCKSWSSLRSKRFSDSDEVERSGRQKNVTLSFLTRIVVLDPNTISEKVKRDLDGPICDFWGTPIIKNEA
jgi:hypothetical protein